MMTPSRPTGGRALWLAVLLFLIPGALAVRDALAVYADTSGAGIAFVSGGFGEEERQEMDGLASRYNLRLTFATRGSGSYVGFVVVSIDDASGNLVYAEAQGPLFFASLPAGAYQVTASLNGTGLVQRVTLGRSGYRELIFYFPD